MYHWNSHSSDDIFHVLHFSCFCGVCWTSKTSQFFVHMFVRETDSQFDSRANTNNEQTFHEIDQRHHSPPTVVSSVLTIITHKSRQRIDSGQKRSSTVLHWVPLHLVLGYTYHIWMLLLLQLYVWQSYEHYNDVIMSAMASQITSLTIVCSTVYSGADQRKHQSSASLAFVRGIHRWPVNSPHKGPVTRKMFPLDGVIMRGSILCEGTCIAGFVVFLVVWLKKQSRRRWYEVPLGSCDATVMILQPWITRPCRLTIDPQTYHFAGIFNCPFRKGNVSIFTWICL